MNYIERLVFRIGFAVAVVVVGSIIAGIAKTNKKVNEDKRVQTAVREGRIIRRTLEPAPPQIGIIYGLVGVMFIFVLAITVIYFLTGFDINDPDTPMIFMFLAIIYCLLIGILPLCKFIINKKRVYYIYDENGIEFHEGRNTYRRNWDYFKFIQIAGESFILYDYSGKPVLNANPSWNGVNDFIAMAQRMINQAQPS